MWNFDNCVALNSVSMNSLLIMNKFPTLQARFQSLIISGGEVEWFGDNHFLRVVFGYDQSEKRLHIFAEKEEELEIALQDIDKNNDIPQFSIPSVPLNFIPFVQKWLKQLQLDNIKMAPIYGIYVLDNEVNLDHWKSANDSLSSLTIADIPFIAQHWEAKKNEDPEEIKRYLKKAIETKESICFRDTNERPIAWAICHTDWSIGALHTMEEFRKQGYGRKVVVYLTEAIRRTGRKAFTQISPDNPTSIILFQNLGFKEVALIRRIYRSPS